ncbi:glycosyltransferase family 4 protein [Hansschlegelia quercus]|uniref:Glycosyltransferase n=1 Tax=Hansschlegelia quercus TaxID=2528245 RepID=A0A4Q9GJL0_9HYPH|nr:glycosyltransferase family 4 protein [Hansschlegelia quercus]TBN51772.1 glycosyltransferase [Hansschlegelia quercus]
MTTDAIGGVWTYAVDLAAGLAERGVRVTLAALGPSPSDAQRRQVSAVGAELIDTALPLDWLEEDARRIDNAGAALTDLANRSGADLVHLNSPIFAASGFTAPVVGVCHSCLATWWAAMRGGEMPASFNERTERLRRGYEACSALIAPSDAFAEATAAQYGVASVAVHNGRAPRVPAPQSSERPFALTAGRLWDPAKNLAALDAAASMMRGTVEAAGPLEGPNGERAATSAVVSLGPLDSEDMARRLGEAGAFVSLALYEPFGLSVLEAAQAGCALVLADIPTFRELWAGTALFVDPRDPAAVAATLDGVLDDRSERERLGALAEARAARFTLDAMTGGTLGVYAQALSRALGQSAA